MRLVNFNCEDGLRLDGLYQEGSSGTVVVHVHGKCGNFYQNDFIQAMFDTYRNHGIGFLAFNHRGHDCVAEGYIGHKVTYLGGSLENFELCLVDIEAATSFARSCGATRVYIQGHSNGSEKALYYQMMSRRPADGMILLSISDSYSMQQRWRQPESPDQQLIRLRSIATSSTEGLRFAPADEYGIKSGDKYYHIPVTYESILSILEGDALKVLRLDDGPRIKPKNPASASLVCLGSNDPYLTVAPQVMAEAIADRIAGQVDLRVLDSANHHFHGHELELTNCVALWINQRQGDLI